MNPLPYVTIAVRFLGLILILFNLGAVFRVGMDLLRQWMYVNTRGVLAGMLEAALDEATPNAGRLALLLLGFYLFLSGRWVIGRLTRGLSWPGGGTCHKCGYDLTGVDSSRCPECGTKLPAKSPEQAKRSS